MLVLLEQGGGIRRFTFSQEGYDEGGNVACRRAQDAMWRSGGHALFTCCRLENGEEVEPISMKLSFRAREGKLEACGDGFGAF